MSAAVTIMEAPRTKAKTTIFRIALINDATMWRMVSMGMSGWMRGCGWLGLGLLVTVGAAGGQSAASVAEWNQPQKPFRFFGNTYYVGPHGLSAVLITSAEGHVLIDGALPESAEMIAGHIQELGFRVEDVKLILSSHVHRDHAGGIAELARLSGATVVGSAWNLGVLSRTGVGRDDPQFGELRPVALVHRVKVVSDGETVRVGALAVTAHLTPGHTPGGMSWTWRSCEGSVCKAMVYADSVTAVSAAGYRYAKHPELILGFAKTFGWLDETPCDVLITAHPDASGVLTGTNADGQGCKKLAEAGRAGLKERLSRESR